MCIDPAHARGDHQWKGDYDVTVDGVINIALIAIAAALIVYLFVALLDPERF